MFRELRADEIEIRIQSIGKKTTQLLLYKDARCDMKILDEIVKPYNWQRVHAEYKNNMYCGVSIKDKETGEWITKWDAGAESKTEGVKGEASDSFKRACVNWGIGRELYTAKNLRIQNSMIEIYDTGRKDKYKNPIMATWDKFSIKEIQCTEGTITRLVIMNSKTKVIVFQTGKFIKGNVSNTKKADETPQTKLPKETLEEKVAKIAAIMKLDNRKYHNIVATLEQFGKDEVSDLDEKTIDAILGKWGME